MESSKPGSVAPGLRSSPGTPSAVNIRRSIPAQKDGPAPRTMTTRTSGGIAAPTRASPCHMAGVIALRRSGRASVTVATAPVMLSSSPVPVSSAGSADTAPMMAGALPASRAGAQALALPLVAPPRPRRETPLSLRIRWMKP